MARGKRVTFYADRVDLEILSDELDNAGSFSYFLTYWDEDQGPSVCSRLIDVGVPHTLHKMHSSICSLACLVVEEGTEVVGRCFDLDAGGRRRTADNITHPDSVRFCIGGISTDRTIIASQLDTLGHTDKSREIFSLFSNIIVKMGFKIASDVIMPGTLQKLRQGWRLTHGLDFPRGADIKLPSKMVDCPPLSETR